MDPVAYSVSDVLKLIGISRTKFYELVGTGEIKVRKIGNRTIILARDLSTFLESLPTIGGRDGK
ncbi:helix-turn-helix domain-containing protein [uncultured Devosia sp.]|uniref:helix-turn-helix domain-containing protein n=1 Tax=uncultured Devosia sp. TaxID=211434 RepID=UPI0035C9B780